MNVKAYILSITAALLSATHAFATPDNLKIKATEPDTLPRVEEVLNEVTVSARQSGTTKLKRLATNTERISSAELRRAACCNLGESFSTNASVDVNYSDAATGAKQIKLLGLSGSYVQMLTENIPNLRGAGSVYGLGYIPGPWMESIQVSKGTSSVKNGYESITGQINIEFFKPQDDQSLRANGYVDQLGKFELNALGNIHINEMWSTGLLLHGENSFASHDENDDGFIDLPQIGQISGMSRWAYLGDNYVFQAGIKYLNEKRISGEHGHREMSGEGGHIPYRIDIKTNRTEIFTKNAYIFDRENDGNIALILSGVAHNENAIYGLRLYDVSERNFYGSLIFEKKWDEGLHELSAGASINYDYFDQYFRPENDSQIKPAELKERETVPGVYAQYTYNMGSNVLLMGGVRYDHSSVYGSMFTPRIHARLNMLDSRVSLHISAGRGYRSPHALLENNFLLASSRKITIGSNLRQEKAMNYGGGVSGFMTVAGKSLNISGEYYYTRFSHQMLVDLDSDPHGAVIKDSENSPSYSHTLQIEVSYPLLRDLTFTAAYKLTDVKVDYGRGLTEKPLTSKNKGLFSLSWTPNMGIWQADVTFAINGGGRMPTPYEKDNGELSWPYRFKTFPQLNAQLTRNFRHWSVYLGGENLTGYRQKTPIIDAGNPWGDNFDATMVYAPIHGALVYIGFRYTFTKY